MIIDREDFFQASLAISIFVHIIVVLVFLFGVPSWFEKLPDDQEIMSFEMVDVSDIANIQTQNAQKQPITKVEDSKKNINSQPEEITKVIEQDELKTIADSKEAVKEQPESESKTVETIPTEKKEVKKLEAKQPPPKPLKDNSKTVNVKKDQKITPKKQLKKQRIEDPIDDILKNLESASDGENLKSNKQSQNAVENEGQFAKGDNFNKDKSLSITEKLLVRRQITDNWNKPIGIKDASQIIVRLHLLFDQDGTVKDVQITGTTCPYGSESSCRLIEQSALRAVRKASPFQGLPPNRFDIWKEVDVDFDPDSLGG